MFSATGNGKHVAERIAGELGTAAVSVTKCLETNRYEFAVDSEEVAIVTPAYFFCLPKNVKEFVENIQLSGDSYVFSVSTYGTTAADSG